MSWAKLLDDKFALATALDIVGDKWTLLILSGGLASVRRFNELEQALGINRSLLSSRLAKLVDAGVIEKRKYQEKPARYEYRVTELGMELRPVIIALARWGEKNFTKDETQLSIIHDTCGGEVDVIIECLTCERTIPVVEVTSRLNPRSGKEAQRIYQESRAEFTKI